MQRRYTVLMALVLLAAGGIPLLAAGCVPLPGPTPTAVGPTERPMQYTLVPTFTPAPPTATATLRPSPVPTRPATSSPTAAPATASAARSTAAPTAPPDTPTLSPSPTRAATRTPTRAATRAATRRPSSATLAPSPAPTLPPGSAWRGEYYNNPDLSGTPALVRDDAQVSFDWGMGSPDSSVPTDRFSARWTRTVPLAEGRWRFHAASDDGVRLFVDGLPIIDQWHTTKSVTYNTSAQLSGGSHLLRLEYFEETGEASVRLWWEPDDGTATDPAHSGAWRGDYFNNRDLSDTPVFSRDDPAVYFDWGDNGPGTGIGGQEFSVRWARRMFIPGGSYRFTVTADDGVRVWLNWVPIIDEWHDSPADTTYEREVNLSNREHELVVEYYQGVGSAQVHVTWEPTSVDWLANLHTCAPANGWVNVYRLAPNNKWLQLNTDEYGENTGRELSLWGIPIDASYGWDGQPYRAELWVGGSLAASQGNIFAGQPAFRIVPGQDARTSWSCAGG